MSDNLPVRQTPQVPALFAEQIAGELEAIQDRISSPSSNKIRFQGNHAIILPNEDQGEEYECVIIDFASHNSYFDVRFDPANPSPPACFSIGFRQKDMKPSENSPDPQHTDCASCPMNQFGSNGRGKACKNTRVLAVMGVAYDDEIPPVWTMHIPPVSLKFFDAYVQKLALRHKTVPLGVVTRVFLDPSVAYPCPKFEVVRPLRPEEFELYMSMRDEARKMITMEPDTSSYVAPVRGPARRVMR